MPRARSKPVVDEIPGRVAGNDDERYAVWAHGGFGYPAMALRYPAG